MNFEPSPLCRNIGLDVVYHLLLRHSSKGKDDKDILSRSYM